ncbi:MAG: hypothetical protein GY810_06000 [Aureispira sp.]|nr:hypothetical protein [Aureispira sp.]
MSLTKLVANYSGYNEWANAKLAQWLGTLAKGILTQKVSSSFESINLTIEHINFAQDFWLKFITQDDLDNVNWSTDPQDASQTLKELVELSSKIKVAFSQYSKSELIEELVLDQPWLKNKLSRYEYIMHVINHSTYHRGQIITIARGLGISENVPNTDYNFYNSID